MAKQTRAYASTGKTIAVISGETHELITQFRVLGDTVSTSLIASRDGTRVFSRVVFPLGSDDNDDRIFTIDTRTNSVVNQLKLSGIRSSFGFIFDMAFDPAGRLLYVPGETIAVVDVATNTVARMLPLSRAVGGIAFDPDGTRLFAVGEDSLLILDPNTGALLESIPLARSDISNIAVRRDGRRVYVTAKGHGADQGQIIIVDPDARSVLKTIFSFGNSPNCVRISQDGSSVFVANSGFPPTDPSFPPVGSDLTRITQFDTADDPALTTARFFSDIPRPNWLALAPDGGQLYATSADLKEVQVFDTASHQKIASVNTGADEPTGIVVVAIPE